ncbi:hypothetical protein BK123_31965 [Paenibacillus lautus]|uniref:Uncharacterized protein n=1 Tax=Paenibacillus lautus TaxID=1401 RepID=A0A1R1ANS9_PAELA|nr:hypothetical protein BK123_31965 [Paenibacillus lautus]
MIIIRLAYIFVKMLAGPPIGIKSVLNVFEYCHNNPIVFNDRDVVQCAANILLLNIQHITLEAWKDEKNSDRYG